MFQRVLNEGGYTVWIDTAGIRAGQKWRTEIAHGIHVMFLHFNTSDSSASPYLCSQPIVLYLQYDYNTVKTCLCSSPISVVTTAHTHRNLPLVLCRTVGCLCLSCLHVQPTLNTVTMR